MKIIIDCPKCSSRHEFDASGPSSDQRCPRCKLIAGSDVPAIILELRKNRAPGQEPILRLIEVLNEKIEKIGMAPEEKRGIFK